MSSDEDLNYIRPVDRIYDVATNRDELDWKGFLHNLINIEGLDPWDIDLSILTKKYLDSLNEVKDIDFNISGKFLTIAVFLLKIKAENLIDVEIRGLDNKLSNLKSSDSIDDFEDGIDSLEELDMDINELSKKKSYKIHLRNPMARKRKVSIYDLIKTLEKTFEQSNKRRVNFFLKNSTEDYSGPVYEKKPKDLKVIISELFSVISEQFSQKSGHVSFNHLTKDINHREGILEKFIPLLHLHNQGKVEINQDEHLGDIKIHRVENLENGEVINKND